MEYFSRTFILVAIMLAYAIPGYVLIKSKAVKPDSISAFSKLLMYGCQPLLTLYSFNKADFSKELVINLLIFLAIIIVLQLIFIGVFYLIFSKKMEDVKYRIINVATTLSNCSFLGVPLLEALFPESQNVAAYSMMYFLSMNMLGWTLVSAIITRDRKDISVKKIILNPATISIVVALPFFITGFKIGANNEIFPDNYLLIQLENAITIMGKMTTPLCMIIMGMRLATIKVPTLFKNPWVYFSIAINQIVFPLFVYGVLTLLGIEDEPKKCMFIMSACPIASVVLNYAEILGQGQEMAANMVLLGAMASIITLPLMAMLIL